MTRSYSVRIQISSNFGFSVSKDMSSHNTSVNTRGDRDPPTPYLSTTLITQFLVGQLGPGDAHAVGGVGAGVLEFDSSMFRVGSGMMLHGFRRVREEAGMRFVAHKFGNNFFLRDPIIVLI